LIEGILASIPDSRLTGHPRHRLVHHASFAFLGVEGESVVQALDMAGIAASSGAACAEGEPEPSFVLKAMGVEPRWGVGSLRLTLGRSNGEADVDRVLEVLPAIVRELRQSA
jgi:cysteine desulfurase